MNVEAGDPVSFRDWFAAVPLPGSVRGTLSAAERWDVAAAGVVSGSVAVMLTSAAAAAQVGDGPSLALAAALATAAATAARAVTRLGQGRPVKPQKKAGTAMVTYTSPDGSQSVQVTADFDGHIQAFAADPTGATWSAGLWDWIQSQVDWLRSHVGYIGPIVVIPSLPQPMPARPADNDA